MDPLHARGELQELYRRALDLADDGRTWAEIADELGIDEPAVGPLLRLAVAKLARLMEDESMNGEGEIQ